MAETQELALGSDNDNMQALLAGEAEETRAWNMWVSNFKDRVLLLFFGPIVTIKVKHVHNTNYIVHIKIKLN